MKPQEINEIWHNAEYRKIVFYRDPIERFLSGFLDKCGPTGHEKQMCNHLDLKGYINLLYKDYQNKKLCEIRDHFRPQWCFCEMYRNQMNHWDVYAFDRSNRAEKIDDFLRKH